MLIEGYLNKLIFTTALVGPSANVFFTNPPIYIVDHKSCSGAGVSWAIIVFALQEDGNIGRAVRGEKIGTLVSNGTGDGQ